MAKRAKSAGGTEYLVVKRFRNVVNGPWFEADQVVELGVDLAQGEIDLLVRAGHLEKA